MSLVTRSSTAGLDANQADQAAAGLIAGQDLDLCSPCYIKTADGKVYMSNATAVNEAAEFVGFTPRAVKSGQPVTLFGMGTRMRYGSGLNPGDVLYMAATDGRLDTAPTTGDGQGLVQVLNDTDVIVTRTNPTNLGLTADGSLTGVKVATVSESNVVGGIPLVFEIPIVAGALGNVDVIMTHKIRVIDAHLILRGAGIATTTLQVKNGATAITNAMAASGSAKDVVRAASIDPASYEIAAAGTLRVTSATGLTQPDALVIVTAVRVP